MIQDANRFIFYHRFIIEMAPLQAYASAIVYSPRNSLSKKGVLGPRSKVDGAMAKCGGKPEQAITDTRRSQRSVRSVP